MFESLFYSWIWPFFHSYSYFTVPFFFLTNIARDFSILPIFSKNQFLIDNAYSYSFVFFLLKVLFSSPLFPCLCFWGAYIVPFKNFLIWIYDQLFFNLSSLTWEFKAIFFLFSTAKDCFSLYLVLSLSFSSLLFYFHFIFVWLINYLGRNFLISYYLMFYQLFNPISHTVP